MGTIYPNIEGVEETLRSLREFPKATGRGVLRQALKTAAAPVAAVARIHAPRDEGDLQRSIVVTTQLTRRHRRTRPKLNEVEVYVGPAKGAGLPAGVLNYASFVEFGTIDTAAKPYLRSAWDSQSAIVQAIFARELTVHFQKAAARLSRKFFKLR